MVGFRQYLLFYLSQLIGKFKGTVYKCIMLIHRAQTRPLAGFQSCLESRQHYLLWHQLQNLATRQDAALGSEPYEYFYMSKQPNGTVQQILGTFFLMPFLHAFVFCCPLQNFVTVVLVEISFVTLSCPEQPYGIHQRSQIHTAHFA